MPNLNHVTLLGNCTRDPEIRYTTSGSPVCTIGMAINHAYGTGDQRKEETCFIDAVCFGKTAELAAEHLSKGKPVLIDGRLQFQTWEGQDGQKRSKHSVLANTVQWFTGSPEPEPGALQKRPSAPPTRPPGASVPGRPQKPQPAPEPDLDDIPF